MNLLIQISSHTHTHVPIYMAVDAVNNRPVLFDVTLNKTIASIGGKDIISWALSIVKGDVLGVPYKVRTRCAISKHGRPVYKPSPTCKYIIRCFVCIVYI